MMMVDVRPAGGVRPGSPEGQERGCICPPVENNHGRGRFVPRMRPRGDGPRDELDGWWVDDDCPLHGLRG